MLRCEILTLRLEDDIQLKINNWLLLNQKKKIRFIQHTYIPSIIILTPEKDSIKKESEIYKAGFTEKRGYFLVAFYFESEIL